MLALAYHTFLRLLRRQVLRFAVFAIVLLPLIYDLGLKGFARTTLPIAALSHPAGLANFLASILAVYLAVTLLADDQATGFTALMMTKPLAPWQYVGGRMLGALAMQAVVWVILCVALGLAAVLRGAVPQTGLVFTLVFAFFGQSLLFALGVLLARGLSPLIAGALALLVNDRVFESFVQNIDRVAEPSMLKSVALWFTNLLYYLAPQVSEFALWGTGDFVYLVDPVRAWLAVGYALVYCLLAFVLTVLAFERARW